MKHSKAKLTWKFHKRFKEWVGTDEVGEYSYRIREDKDPYEHWGWILQEYHRGWKVSGNVCSSVKAAKREALLILQRHQSEQI